MAVALKVDLLHALEDFLSMYTHPSEEVMVIESIANTLDEKADVMKIRVYRKAGEFYYNIIDNAKGMNATDFERYHTVALSSKERGTSIGFAGVGAKIYLAAWKGAEIITETNTGRERLASRMFRSGNDLLYEYIQPTIKQRGTSYTVKLSSQHYDNLVENIWNYVVFWFNYAILNGKGIFIDGTKVKPWKPTIASEISDVKAIKKINFPFTFWITKDDVPEERRHIEFVVFGKRIKIEKVDWLYEVDDQYRNKFCGMINANAMAHLLTANKEEFKKSYYTNTVKSELLRELHKWLKDNNILLSEKYSVLESHVIQNILTEQLDKLLAKSEWRWLNPWFSPRTKTALLPDPEGDKSLMETEGEQRVSGTKSGGGSGSGVPIPGDDPGKGFEEGPGGIPGSEYKRKARGIQIGSVNYPDDPREGWIDPENKGVIYNEGHPFHKKVSISTSAKQYNLTRVVATQLIKYASDKQDVNAKDALDTLSTVLHEVWPS